MRFVRLSLLAATLCLATTAPARAIVGGTDVPEGERGYVAYISIDGLFSCTGTLVSPTFVVTAGHCSTVTAGTPINVPIGKAGQEVTVTLGSVDRDDPMGERPGVSRVIVHPEYVFTNNGGSSADIALLELATPSVQTPVKVIAKGEESLLQPGALAQIAGFGVSEEGGSAPPVMQQAQVPLVADDEAARAYATFETRTQIAAGFAQGGVDSCQGDSGGPLLVTAPDGSLRLAGDTSYGDGCARPGKPGVYGRLSSDAMRDFVAAHAPDAIAAPPATPVGGAPAQAQPAGPPASAPPAASKRRPTPCRRLHRGTRRHNRSAKHRREVRRCVKRRRGARNR